MLTQHPVNVGSIERGEGGEYCVLDPEQETCLIIPDINTISANWKLQKLTPNNDVHMVSVPVLAISRDNWDLLIMNQS